MSNHLRVVKRLIGFSFFKATAYWLNNWGDMLSVLLYNIAFFIFIKIMFAHINTIGGYSENDLLFLYFVSESVFYFLNTFVFLGLNEIIQSVRNGKIDYYLVRPFPLLGLVMLLNLNSVGVVTEVLPFILFAAVLIKWHLLHLKLLNIVLGTSMWLIGIVILTCAYLIVTFRVFKTGEASQQLALIYKMASHPLIHLIPFEAIRSVKLWYLFWLLPQFVVIHISTSVFLGKMSYELFYHVFCISFLIMIIMLACAYKSYIVGLKEYASASS